MRKNANYSGGKGMRCGMLILVTFTGHIRSAVWSCCPILQLIPLSSFHLSPSSVSSLIPPSLFFFLLPLSYSVHLFNPPLPLPSTPLSSFLTLSPSLSHTSYLSLTLPLSFTFPSLSLTLLLSLTLPLSHSPPFPALSHSLFSLSHTHPLFHSPLFLTLLSLSHSLSLTHSPLSLTRPLSLTLYPSLSHTLPPSLSHTLSLTFLLSLKLPLSSSHYVSLTLPLSLPTLLFLSLSNFLP